MRTNRASVVNDIPMVGVGRPVTPVTHCLTSVAKGWSALISLPSP